MIDCTPPLRIYNQYQNKRKIVSWLDMSQIIAGSLCSASNAVINSYDIDTNEGEQLDVIGRIVVQPRGYINTITFDVSQCNSDGDFECNSDGDFACSALSVANDNNLSDTYYRLLLKAKIAKNTNTATLDDTLTALKIISPDAEFLRVVDNQDMTMSVEFYGLVDPITRALIVNGDIVPRPQGVALRGILEGYNMPQCNGEGEYQCNAEGDFSSVGFVTV